MASKQSDVNTCKNCRKWISHSKRLEEEVSRLEKKCEVWRHKCESLISEVDNIESGLVSENEGNKTLVSELKKQIAKLESAREKQVGIADDSQTAIKTEELGRLRTIEVETVRLKDLVSRCALDAKLLQDAQDEFEFNGMSPKSGAHHTHPTSREELNDDAITSLEVVRRTLGNAESHVRSALKRVREVEFEKSALEGELNRLKHSVEAKVTSDRMEKHDVAETFDRYRAEREAMSHEIQEAKRVIGSLEASNSGLVATMVKVSYSIDSMATESPSSARLPAITVSSSSVDAGYATEALAESVGRLKELYETAVDSTEKARSESKVLQAKLESVREQHEEELEKMSHCKPCVEKDSQIQTLESNFEQLNRRMHDYRRLETDFTRLKRENAQIEELKEQLNRYTNPDSPMSTNVRALKDELRKCKKELRAAEVKLRQQTSRQLSPVTPRRADIRRRSGGHLGEDTPKTPSEMSGLPSPVLRQAHEISSSNVSSPHVENAYGNNVHIAGQTSGNGGQLLSVSIDSRGSVSSAGRNLPLNLPLSTTPTSEIVDENVALRVALAKASRALQLATQHNCSSQADNQDQTTSPNGGEASGLYTEDEVESRVADLLAQVEECTRENERLVDELSREEENTERIREELERVVHRLQQERDQLFEQVSKKEEFMRQLAEQEEETKELYEKKLREQQRRVKDLEHDSDTMRAKLDAQKATLSDINKKHLDGTEKLKQQLNSKERELKEVASERSMLQERVKRMGDSVDSLRGELASVRASVNTHKETVQTPEIASKGVNTTTIVTRAISVGVENDALNHVNTATDPMSPRQQPSPQRKEEEQRDGLAKHQKSVEDKRNGSRQPFSPSRAIEQPTVMTGGEALANLEKELTQTRQLLHQEVSAKDELHHHANDLQLKYDSLERDYGHLKTKLATECQARVETDKDLKMVVNEKNESMSRVRQLESQVDALTRQILALKDEISKASELTQILERELERCRPTSQAVNGLNDQIVTLERRLQEVSDEKSRVEKVAADRLLELQEIFLKRFSSDSEVSQLRTLLKKTEGELKKEKKENSKLVSKLTISHQAINDTLSNFVQKTMSLHHDPPH